jgi:hypothetical protein
MPLLKQRTVPAAGSSHLSIDETWVEDEEEKIVPKTFESLKRMFLPSSIVSLRGSTSRAGADEIAHVVSGAAGRRDDEEEDLVLKGVKKVRSKSMAVPVVSTQFTRGKVSKMALRKLFYNRNKPNDSINTSI